jgi:hypothetical protein
MYLLLVDQPTFSVKIHVIANLLKRLIRLGNSSIISSLCFQNSPSWIFRSSHKLTYCPTRIVSWRREYR